MRVLKNKKNKKKSLLLLVFSNDRTRVVFIYVCVHPNLTSDRIQCARGVKD